MEPTNLPALDDYEMIVSGVDEEAKYVVRNIHTGVHEYTGRYFYVSYDNMQVLQAAFEDIMYPVIFEVDLEDIDDENVFGDTDDDDDGGVVHWVGYGDITATS